MKYLWTFSRTYYQTIGSKTKAIYRQISGLAIHKKGKTLVDFFSNGNSTILAYKRGIIEQNLKYNGDKHTLGCIYTNSW